ncbi:MAG: hypothetical protein ACRDT6_24010 [Micromonosporaceae bacterium]
MRRTAYQMKVLAGLAVAAVALAGLVACGGEQREPGASVELTADEEALVDVGFGPDEVGPAPSASAVDNRGHKGRRPGYLGKRVLHGELVISTKNGPRTVLVQRGTITAVDADSVTVKSADGYTLTWAFGDKLRVRQRGKQLDVSALKVGQQIGVAGGKTKDGGNARMIVIAAGK